MRNPDQGPGDTSRKFIPLVKGTGNTGAFCFPKKKAHRKVGSSVRFWPTSYLNPLDHLMSCNGHQMVRHALQPGRCPGGGIYQSVSSTHLLTREPDAGNLLVRFGG